MFQGNWKCSKCGGAITELPFEPRSEAGLTCRDCYFKDKGGGGAPGGGVAAPADAPEPGMDMPAGDMDDREAPILDPDAPSGGEVVPAPPAEGEPIKPGERKMFTGDWKCAGCGAPITQLPFEPRDTSGLKCIDCF